MGRCEELASAASPTKGRLVCVVSASKGIGSAALLVGAVFGGGSINARFSWGTYGKERESRVARSRVSVGVGVVVEVSIWRKRHEMRLVYLRLASRRLCSDPTWRGQSYSLARGSDMARSLSYHYPL